MKIILNPKYEALREYLTDLEYHFEHDGHEIHNGRNVIRTLKTNSYTLCVKRFAPPALKRRVQQIFYKIRRVNRHISVRCCCAKEVLKVLSR